LNWYQDALYLVGINILSPGVDEIPVAPVINVQNPVSFTGTGKVDDPYVIYE